MVVPLRRDELVRVGSKRRRNLVNGWFGLGRGRFLAADHPRRPLAEVLRVIMNLTASNVVFLPFAGDIASLPYVATGAPSFCTGARLWFGRRKI